MGEQEMGKEKGRRDGGGEEERGGNGGGGNRRRRRGAGGASSHDQDSALGAMFVGGTLMTGYSIIVFVSVVLGFLFLLLFSIVVAAS